MISIIDAHCTALRPVMQAFLFAGGSTGLRTPREAPGEAIAGSRPFPVGFFYFVPYKKK